MDPANPQRSLEIRADVALEADADFAFAAKEGAEYGVDLHDFDAPGDMRVTAILTPRRVVASQLG